MPYFYLEIDNVAFYLLEKKPIDPDPLIRWPWLDPFWGIVEGVIEGVLVRQYNMRSAAMEAPSKAKKRIQGRALHEGNPRIGRISGKDRAAKGAGFWYKIWYKSAKQSKKLAECWRFRRKVRSVHLRRLGAQSTQVDFANVAREFIRRAGLIGSTKPSRFAGKD